MQWYMQNSEQTSKTVSAIFYLKIKKETNRKWDIMNDNVISKLNKWNSTCQNFITSLKAVMRELFYSAIYTIKRKQPICHQMTARRSFQISQIVQLI